MADHLDKSDFDHRIGEVFTIALDTGGTLELRLAAVDELGGTSAGGARDPFALLLRGGPRDRYLPQRTYELEHPAMGALPVFLVPLGPDAEGMRYEAVFT